MEFVSAQGRADYTRTGGIARAGVCLLICCLAIAASAPGHTASAASCTAPPNLVKFQAPLPRLAAALAAHKPIRIVALGSSSTLGKGASSRDRAYPARLQKELQKAWPKSEIRVVNAGKNGQLARHMLKRMKRDVARVKPQLVIWQTGVNDAIRGVPLKKFKTQLRDGIKRLREMGADVVLFDQQYYPRFRKVKNGMAYLIAVKDVAKEFSVPVLRRFRIMKHLVASAQFTTAALLSPDGFHLNDTSYDCLSHLLARSLRSAAKPGPADASAN